MSTDLPSNREVGLIQLAARRGLITEQLARDLIDGLGNRAATVVLWLVKAGIDPSRLTPKGYGEDVPLANIPTTPQYRDLHQRVEFHMAQCKDEKAQ